MAFLMISFVGLITVFVFVVIPASDSSNFPLDSCSRGDMDVLGLEHSTKIGLGKNVQRIFFKAFVSHLLRFRHNKTTPRVLCAHVHDMFSAHNPDIDVSSWYFNISLPSLPYGIAENQSMQLPFKNVQEVLELKIAFVHRLFSEMSECRENATHVAVIFFDGARCSFDETRSIPQIVQQQRQQQQHTHIKIFVVVVGGNYGKEKVYLRDTLLLPDTQGYMSPNTLILAICKQCVKGWFSFAHSHSSESLSCYKMFSYFSTNVTWVLAVAGCQVYHGATAAAIETPEELSFLRIQLYKFFNKTRTHNLYNYSEVSFQVYIGLLRDSTNVAHRFHWLYEYPNRFRPLVVSNWLQGKPSEGHGNACAMWQFSWSNYRNNINISRNDASFYDGWTDVSCNIKLSTLTVCEIFLPRRLEDINMRRINPASKESFRKALSSRDVIKLNENIVSVSANIASPNIRKFLKETASEFPIFDCGVDAGDPRYISYVYVCDNVDHCMNGRDETLCVLSESHGSSCRTGQLLENDFVFCDSIYDCQDGSDEYGCTGRCPGVSCCDGTCLPLHMVLDGEIDCNCLLIENDIENDETESLYKYMERNETCSLICNRDKCVLSSQLNDGRKDCTGPEGPLDETIGKLETVNTCFNKLGHIIWAPRCVYVRDRFGGSFGCRDMSHLKNCTEFECPVGYFKCPNAYCIPQHYVLDGKIDCATGEEEQKEIIESCFGNFVCSNSTICLHPDLVCDGHPECPYKDDEVDCDVLCIDGFRCISGTVTVLEYNRSIPLKNVNFFGRKARYLDMSGVDLNNHNVMNDFAYSRILEYVIIIVWSNCNIDRLSPMFPSIPIQLQKLDVSYNRIVNFNASEVLNFAFGNIRHLNLSYNSFLVKMENVRFRNLELLDLSHTGLSYYDESILTWVPNLKHLNLSYTLISSFHRTASPCYFTLYTLSLRGLTIEDFREELLNGLTISQHLYTDQYEFCCPQIRGTHIPQYTCHAPEDAISSCFDLIRVTLLRGLLWVVAVLGVLGNTTVVVYRVIWDRSVLRTGYGLFVTNLGISDFLMGIYLFIIAGADYYYRDIYVMNDQDWRESVGCSLAGFLATISIETSTFFCFLITLDRFLVIKFPFGQMKMTKNIKMIALVFSWVIGFFLALVPVVFRFEISYSNAMCLGLPLISERQRGWEYSFSVFIVFNFVMFLIIVYGQRAIFKSMSENMMSRSDTNHFFNRPNDIIVAKQLSLVALSNFLCWFPVGIMGILSLCDYEINNDVYAWTTVVVLPINSAANPLLYTIPALMAKWDNFKYRDTSSQQMTC